jgi:hypothetical protein
MMIDQRNAGAALSTFGYAVDRFSFSMSTNKGTLQQNAGGVTPPTGFKNYWGFTTTSAYSITAGDYFGLQQRIEGYNLADMGFGATGASTFTVSFWVRSSLTGTFGFNLQNGAQTRSFAATYTISAANTWEYKTITVAGDTTGAWLTNNGVGLVCSWGIGVGSTFNISATGAWQTTTSPNGFGTTGATSVVGTLNATWYITGVQLEVGPSATSFDYRPYGTELALCQRYYWKMFPNDTPRLFGSGQCFSTTAAGVQIPFQVPMRIRPTALEQSGTASDYQVLNNAGSPVACSAVPTYNAVTTNYMAWVALTVSSGIAAGDGTTCLTNNAAAYLAWSAEL